MVNVFHGDVYHLKPAKGECEMHLEPSEGLARKLIVLVRERGEAGIDVCVDCIHRAKKDAEPKCPDHGKGGTRKIMTTTDDGEDEHWFVCIACNWQKKVPRGLGT